MVVKGGQGGSKRPRRAPCWIRHRVLPLAPTSCCEVFDPVPPELRPRRLFVPRFCHGHGHPGSPFPFWPFPPRLLIQQLPCGLAGPSGAWLVSAGPGEEPVKTSAVPSASSRQPPVLWGSRAVPGLCPGLMVEPGSTSPALGLAALALGAGFGGRDLHRAPSPGVPAGPRRAGGREPFRLCGQSRGAAGARAGRAPAKGKGRPTARATPLANTAVVFPLRVPVAGVGSGPEDGLMTRCYGAARAAAFLCWVRRGVQAAAGLPLRRGCRRAAAAVLGWLRTGHRLPRAGEVVAGAGAPVPV